MSGCDFEVEIPSGNIAGDVESAVDEEISMDGVGIECR